MDVTAYYYNYYPYHTQVPSNEALQCGNENVSAANENYLGPCDGQLSFYEEQLYTYEGEDDNTDASSIPLPQELTNMFKPLECELCGVTVICPASAFTHYEGKIHIKNVNAYMKEHYNVYGSLKIRKERFTPVTCDICNIELTSKVVYQQHFSGKQHLKNLKKKQYSIPVITSDDICTDAEGNLLKDLPPPPPPPKLSDFVCEICNISTNTEQQLQFHKNGQKHKKKLNKLKEMNIDNELSAFYNNEWTEGSENYVEGLSEPASFVENPDMDYPLQFNENAIESYNEGTLPNEESEFENTNNETSELTISESSNIKQPTTLEEINGIIMIKPIDLQTENERLLSSTGVILRQLSVIPVDGTNTDNNNQKQNDSNNNTNVMLKCDITEESENISKDELFLNQSVENSLNTNVKINSEEDLARKSNTTSDSQIMEEDINSLCKAEVTTNPKINVTSANETMHMDPTLSKDSSFDQVLTKLAIEEIVKESSNFAKTVEVKEFREETNKEASKSKYQYDKAGYRINEDASRCQNTIKENKVESQKDYVRKSTPNSQKDYVRRSTTNYSYNRNRNNYDGSWSRDRYDKWKNYNYKMYNNYNNYSDRFRNDRNGGYRSYNNRDHYRYKNRVRNKRYSSDEEHRSSRTSRRSNGKDYRKRTNGSKSKRDKSSSRSRKRRSYSTESTCSERSRSESSDRDRKKKFRKSKRSDCSNDESNDKRYKKDKKYRTDNTDTESTSRSSSRSSSSSRDSDVSNNNRICKKDHKCQKSYNKCPYKHKETCTIETTEQQEEETSHLWNSEPPTNNNEFQIEVKVEKDEHNSGDIRKDEIDSALSSYVTSSGTYYCKYCIVSTKSNELFREHLQTPKHELLVKFKNKM